MKPQHWAIVVATALIVSVLLVGAILKMRPPAASSAESFTEKVHTLEPLFPAPAFAYTDQRGDTVTALTLKGTPYIANFIFTTCRTICPLLTTKMVQLHRLLPGASVRFVSFSVDPSHDTPEVLATYARSWNPEETRWTLLATDERTLPLTAAGFHITAMKTGSPNDSRSHHSLLRLPPRRRRRTRPRCLRQRRSRGLPRPRHRRPHARPRSATSAHRLPRRRHALPPALLRELSRAPHPRTTPGRHPRNAPPARGRDARHR